MKIYGLHGTKISTMFENNRIINWQEWLNQNMTKSAEERLDLTSVQNLFHSQVKSSSVLGSSDHILVIHDN